MRAAIVAMLLALSAQATDILPLQQPPTKVRGLTTAQLVACTTGNVSYDKTLKVWKQCTSNAWLPVAAGTTAITALGTVDADTAFSFATTSGDVQTITISGDRTYSASGMSATYSRTIVVLITASGSRTLAWDADWKWNGPKPSALATGVTGQLVLYNYGSADTTIVAAWSELGSG